MIVGTDVERHRLDLERPFTIARGTTTTTDVVAVRIEDENGLVGVGSAGPSTHYGETADTVEAVVSDPLAIVEEVGDPHQSIRIEGLLSEAVGGNPAARAAVSVAIYDLVAKRFELPLYRYWGLDPTRTLETSYTIGIDDPDGVRERTETALERGFGTLKVKLGSGDDERRVEVVRDVAPDARLFVDANGGWTPKEAVRTIARIQ